MSNGIELEVLRRDEDSIKLRVRASNARFAGAVDVWESLDCLTRIAARLRGFPTRPADRRVVDLGSRGAGAADLWFESDELGHVHVRVELVDDSYQSEGTAKAEFGVLVEAAAIDALVRELERAPGAVGARFVLPAAR